MSDWEMETLRLKDFLVALDAVLTSSDIADERDTREAAGTLCKCALEIVRQQLDEHDQACREHNERQAKEAEEARQMRSTKRKTKTART